MITSEIKENQMIFINTKKTIEIQRKIKQERWRGYNVRIIKDSNEAVSHLSEIMKKRENQLV